MMRLALMAVLVTMVTSGPHHREHHYAEPTEADYSWAEAEGYEECEEFFDIPSSNLDKNALNQLSDNIEGSSIFRVGPKPKRISDICTGLYPCPQFQDLEETSCGYQSRLMLAANWTTTEIDLTAPNGYREAYFRLHGYRNGTNNDRGQWMSMMIPVMKKWWLDVDFNVIAATMSFGIPPEFQNNPPASTNPRVSVEEWEELKIYSRTYGGNRGDLAHLGQFELLEKALDKANIKTYPYLRMSGGFTRPGYGRQRRELIVVDSQYFF